MLPHHLTKSSEKKGIYLHTITFINNETSNKLWHFCHLKFHIIISATYTPNFKKRLLIKDKGSKFRGLFHLSVSKTLLNLVSGSLVNMQNINIAISKLCFISKRSFANSD